MMTHSSFPNAKSAGDPTKITVRDMMEQDVYSCPSTASLGQVTRIFIERHVSSLPVVDPEGHVVGFISDGDIMAAIAAHKTRSIYSGGMSTMLYYDDEPFERKALELRERTVMDRANRKVVCTTADQPLGQVAELLSKKSIKKLPVIDGEGRLIGVVLRSQVTRYVFDLLFNTD